MIWDALLVAGTAEIVIPRTHRDGSWAEYLGMGQGLLLGGLVMGHHH